MLDIDKWTEDQQREEEIRCPNCDGLYDFLEDAFNDGLITCWGGEDIIELECTHCEKIFFVIEKVRRTFEIQE